MSTASLTSAVRRLRQTASAALADEHDDQQLLRTFVERQDPAAFEALVRRHGPMVLGVCRRVLANHHDAEDAFQATLLVLARTAGRIRRAASLAGWLHGVAHRIALRALRDAVRRRKRERRPPPSSPSDPAHELTWREVQAALDDEITRLPELHRTPFVLCCLEGIPNAEAARRLGLKEGTVCSRLANARKRLGQALKRRGISLSAALAALTVAGPAAAVPAALAQSVADPATLSPAVLALAEGAAPTLFAVRVKLAGLFLLLCLCAAGLATYALGQPPAPATKEPDPPAKPAPDDPDGLTVSGTVLGPDGKPVRGAKVYLTASAERGKAVPPRAVTGADGTFRLKASKLDLDRNEAVVATADGIGSTWARLQEVRKELTLRLVDDVPVAGRVLDLEGRPVAGARVRVWGVRRLAGESLDGLVKDLRPADGRNGFWDAWGKHQRGASQLYPPPGLTLTATADRQGRFRLSGLGRERVVELDVEGDGIARAHLVVLTRPGPMRGLPAGVHAATFEYLAGPEKPVRGVVRDRRTGKPLAGVRVSGQPAREDGFGAASFATTDADGRFTLRGLSKAKSYSLGAGGVPFVQALKDVADTPGLDPITTELAVEKALALRVRVVDKQTGRPVRAYVQYALRGDNRSLDAYPSYLRNAVGWEGTDHDGWNAQTALPGPALIAVQAIEGEYTRSRLKDKHANDDFIGNLVPAPLHFDSYHAIVPVSPDEKEPKSLEVVIRLDRGRSVKGRVVGPDDQPLAGTGVLGLTAVIKVSHEDSERLEGPTFEAVALDSDQPRVLVFYHEQKKLGGTVTVRGDEREPVTVKLGAPGSLTGRVVDGDGKPAAGAEVMVAYHLDRKLRLPAELLVAGRGTLPDVIAVRPAKAGPDGRFRLDGLIPGLKYDLGFNSDERFSGWAKRAIVAGPGRTVEVGDVRAPAPGR